MTDEWMAYRSAAVMLVGDGPVLDALMAGKINSRGLNNLLGEEEDIPADIWARWSFTPTFKGPVPEWMRAAGWLVPPGKELRRICCGFKEIRLLRADVERLAEPVTAAPPAEVGSNAHKLQSVSETIKRIGMPALVAMSQKERELKIIKEVKDRHGADVSDRYAREHFAEAKKQG
jgi:hypothetical protein